MGVARHLGNIGNAYRNLKMHEKANEYCNEALKLSEELKDKHSVALWLGNIGGNYEELHNYPKALEYSLKALKISKEINDKQRIAIWLGNIGSIYTVGKKYDESEKYLLQALALSDSIGAVNLLKDQCLYLSDLYTEKGNYQKSLYYFKKYSSAKDSLFNKEKEKELTKHELNYEFEKKEAAIKADQEKKDALAVAEKKKQAVFFWFICAIAVSAGIIALIILRSLRITKKQKLVIQYQKDLVEGKQKEILDSIRYAKRIQAALLPPEKYIEKNINRLTKKI